MAKPKKEVPATLPVASLEELSVTNAGLLAENEGLKAQIGAMERDMRTAASADPTTQTLGEDHALLQKALGESESEATTLRVENATLREKLLDTTAELRRQEREVSKLQANLKDIEGLNAGFRAELIAIDDTIGAEQLVLIDGKIARPASIRQLQVRQGAQNAGATHFNFKLDDAKKPSELLTPPPAIARVPLPQDDETVIRRNLSYILGIAPDEDTAVNMAIRCKARAIGR